MVTELQQLLRDTVSAPPSDHLDVGAVVHAGRRRVRARRTAVASGVAAVAVVAVVTSAVVAGGGRADRGAPADQPPHPDAPTLRLSDATPAVAGRDYDELSSYTNRNLDEDNGQYYDGVTDDGLILFRDGPRADQLYPRFALMDPATGDKTWLPRLAVGQTQTWPVELSAERIVLAGAAGPDGDRLTAYVLDRGADAWRSMTWHGLAQVSYRGPAQVGPDGRLYIGVPATQGEPPPGGWPTGPDGEADDANADGDTYDLWSLSLTRASDVRDERLRFGSLDFTRNSMVWTDATNGHPGAVHVRDLASGQEHSFDPRAGARCNLLGFGATDDRVMMSEYCGTYARGVRDDRVQVLTTDGDQVATLQSSGIDGYVSGAEGPVVVRAYAGPRDGTAGTYVYDLADNRLLRLSEASTKWGAGSGVAPARLFFWDTPVNGGHGQTTHLARLLD